MTDDRSPDIGSYVHSHSQDHTCCPSCGRYVGPLELCPYCRATHGKRTIVRVAKYLTPILGIAGIFLLQHLGQTMGNPRVSLADLTERSNFAFVEVEGVVCDVPRLYHAVGSDDPTAGTLEFCLDDGTAQTRVKTYEDATRRIIDAGRVPAMGDRVIAVGNYQRRTHRHSMIVGAPEELTITTPAPEAEIDARDLAVAPRDAYADLSRVRVTGRIHKTVAARESKNKGFTRTNYNAELTFTGVKQDGAWLNAKVVLPWSLLELAGEMSRTDPAWAGAPVKGAMIRVTGALRYERFGKQAGWRIYPRGVADIEVIDRVADAEARRGS